MTGGDGDDLLARLAGAWTRFADEQCRGYSPLYDEICRAVAADEAVLRLVASAPRPGWQPNVLLAAAHYLVLPDGDGNRHDHRLADVYADPAAATHSTGLAGRAFVDLVLDQRDAVAALLATRRTNTNECGRSAVLVPALRWVATRFGEPVALLDAGASAGLNLNLDRYRIDYGDRGSTGPSDAAVRIDCAVEGGAPIADRAPEIAARVGLDRAPVDLTDDDEVRWLLACVWPDTGRLDRTRAAIAEARAHPPAIVRGDMVDDLAATAGALRPDLPLCIVTSWAAAYLRREDRVRFAAEVERIALDRPVAWISAEGAGVVDAFDVDAAHVERWDDGVVPSVLGAVVHGGGSPLTTVLGTCHPHGTWLRWS